MSLIELDHARIDGPGGALVDGLSVRSDLDRVGLVGDWSALFRLLAGEAVLVAGRAQIIDMAPERAVRRGKLGFAPFDPTLPERWTVRELLIESALLLGMSSAQARREASSVSTRLGLTELGTRALGRLQSHERRAVLIAHATLGGPAALALELPLARLDDASARWVADVVMRASEGRRLLVSVEAAQPGAVERALVEQLQEVLIVRGHGIVAQAPAAQALGGGRRYGVIVSRHAAALARRLQRSCPSVELRRHDGMIQALDALTAADLEMLRGARLIVELGEDQGPDVVLDAALELQAPVLELLPLS
jgi:ABC-2 type transport system ATP-binding protein